MYSSKIPVILFISMLTLTTNIDGFLLEPDLTSSTGVNNQCISMDTCMYLAEKKELRNQMFQFQLENEKSLQILTNQLQHKLSVIDDKLLENTKPKHNITIEHANLEQKYRDLELNFSVLQENNRLLHSSYVHQKYELALLKNTTTEFRNELSELKLIKSVQQVLDLHAVQSKIQSLEQKTYSLTVNQNAVQSKIQSLEQTTNSLTINQDARSQDLLALYNMTRVMENKVNQMGTNFTTQILSHELKRNATTETHFNDLINKVHDIESKQNATFADVISKISSLEGKVSNNSKRVAVTACVGSTQSFSDAVVRFSTVRSEIGINNIATFKSSGKFVCEFPGLYYISAHICTHTGNSYVYVKKNNDLISSSRTEIGSSTNSISAVAELQVNDTLYVDTTSYIYGGYSCISIVKIK